MRQIGDSIGDCVDRRTRILLYSHDSFGLGHLRRNLTLATALVDRFAGADVLIATGSPCATQFTLPPGVEVVKLPSIGKDDRGAYVARNLGSPLDRVLALRRGLLLEIRRTFAPQLLVVDHQVLGLGGEVRDLLIEARGSGVRTMLGLRDIVDAPARVVRDWDSTEVQWALEEGYDAICVYGDPRVFDVRSEYRLSPRVASRTAFTGYVVRRGAARDASRPDRERRSKRKPHVLITVGGGEDGAERIQRYLDALALAPAQWESTIITGPLMRAQEARAIKRRAAGSKGVRVRRFHDDLPHLMRESSLVIAMCGYNVAAEILQSRCPAIFLPRVFPRVEQLVRASRFSSLGLSRFLVDPRPEEMRAEIEAALEHGHVPAPALSLDGCHRFCDIAAGLLGETGSRVAPFHAQRRQS